MSTNVNIFRSSGSSSSRTSSGGGGGTVVSAVGKSVYFKSIDFQNWTIANANLYDNLRVYDFSIVDNLIIAVTTDGNEPQADLSNVLFASEDIHSEIDIYFKIEVNGVVYKAVLNIFFGLGPIS